MAERAIGRAAICALVVLATMLIGAGTASANVEIHHFEAFPSETQAGGHPDLTISLKVDYYNSPQLNNNCECNDAKDVHIELPAGFIGNPHATPQCGSAEFARDECALDSQIGVAEPTVELGGETVIGPFRLPLYNLTPKPTQAGLYGWKVPLLDTPIYTVIEHEPRATTASTCSPTASFSTWRWSNTPPTSGACRPTRATTKTASASRTTRTALARRSCRTPTAVV